MGLKKAKLIAKKILNHDVFELKFFSENFEFEKGQFVNIKIDDQGQFPCFRAYSIAGQNKKNEFDLCIKIVENGRGSNWLNQIKNEAEVEFLGPIGKFTFQKNNNDVFFVATGTGVAPFKAMIEEELNNGFKGNIKLLFGLRNEENVFYKELFEDLEKKHKNFQFYLTLSRPNDLWKGLQGRVTEHLEKLINTKDDVYICGLKAMIDSITDILEEIKFPKEQIFTEKFD